MCVTSNLQPDLNHTSVPEVSLKNSKSVSQSTLISSLSLVFYVSIPFLASSLDLLRIVPPLHFALAAYYEYQITQKEDHCRDIEHDVPLIHVALKSERSPDNNFVVVSGITNVSNVHLK